ncbi:MAG: mechanosensitive ion channel [Campylobacterota bacterium]|nr:mechanosensitive ion channel [Campylobacterota bacterium]
MKYLLVTLSFLYLLLGHLSASETVLAQQSEQAELKEQVQIEKEYPFIAVSAVPEEAVKTLLELKDISLLLTEEKHVLEMRESIPAYVDSIEALLEDPLYNNLQYESIRNLQKMQAEWSIYLKQLREWEKVLKSRIEVYDSNRAVLEKASVLWGETHINANSEMAPQVIQDHVASVIVEIEKLRVSAKKGYDLLLTNSNVLTTKVLLIKQTNEKLQNMEIQLSNQVFHQNRPPFIDLLLHQSFAPVKYLKDVLKTVLEKLQEFRIYHENHSENIWLLLVVVVIIGTSVGYVNFLYRKRRLFIREESYSKPIYYFIKRPFSTAMILIELAVVFIYPDSPKAVRELEVLIILIPIARVLQTVLPKEVITHFYIYFLLYFISLIEKNSIGFSLDNRLLNIMLSIGLFLFIVQMIRTKVMEFIPLKVMRKLVSFLLPLFAMLLLISVAANFYGGVQLAERITEGIFRTIHASIIFYVLTIILTGYVIIMLRRRISTASNILDQYAYKVERTISFLLKFTMFFWWFLIVTKVLGIYTHMVEFKEKVLAFSWEIATTTISVQSIVDFIVIVVGTWFIAKAVRTVLEVEVFSRFSFPRGIPTAILTTLNYVIVITGAIIALSSLGITPEQFTLVFGALGVGIGFGLRNIIANFVSGIIMVFERPIQIGDTIEIDSTMGTVLGIGTRSSSIKTFDGSEVIIPNADFIATKVTNWTLSDDRRRKVLLFKVDFDSNIDDVLKIMKTIAIAHPNVLKDPEPLAAFQGFGDYYLEFKLYFWLSENLIVAQSDIAIGVYKALKNAGVMMPLPKQENLHSNYQKGESI